MTLTIPISPHIEARLRDYAMAQGKDLATVVIETVEEKLACGGIVAPSATPAQRLAAWDDFVRDTSEWAERNLPAGHNVDDSRESIYEGRGE